MVEYFEGILKIANLVLALIAGIIAISLFKSSRRYELRAWKILIIALVFFAVQEVLGALRAFDVYSSPFLTHVVPSVILGLLIYALAIQLHIHHTSKQNNKTK